ncbi:MAG: hypothetical protein R2881_08835 [Eubacteriales bacterium]
MLSGVVLVLFVLFYLRCLRSRLTRPSPRATGIPTRVYIRGARDARLGHRRVWHVMMGALADFEPDHLPRATAMRIGKRYLSVTILSAVVAAVDSSSA